MAYYPPPGSHQTFVYPNTPLASSNYLTPQPNVIYVPSRTSSRNSRHDDRERRHGRSHSDSHGHSHSSSSRKHGHRRHESDGHHKHRRSSSHRRRDRSPQVVAVVHPQGVPAAQPNPYYPDPYQYYRPTWTQRLRQFFGLAPNPRDYNYNYGPHSHSSGFFRRLRKQRYYDPNTNVEVDRYGRPVYRR